jgi:DNA gyrase subunit A
MEDLIDEEATVVTLSSQGYIKRTDINNYKLQKRGGVGIIGTENKEDDFTTNLFVASTHSYLLIFTDKGSIYWLKVYKIPEGSRYSKGRPIINLVEKEKDEKITSIIPVREFDPDYYLFIATEKGIIKKTSLEAYSRPRKGGIRAINLDEEDKVVSVSLTDGEKTIMLATKNGMACKFNEKDARPIGRTSRGVKGINLAEDDKLVSMIIVSDKTQVLTLAENGFGKQTNSEEYRLINRGGKGVRNLNVTSKTGKVISVKAVDGNEQLMLITKKGMIIRTKVEDISVIGRNTQGVRVVRLRESDKLIGCAKLVLDEEEESN